MDNDKERNMQIKLTEETIKNLEIQFTSLSEVIILLGQEIEANGPLNKQDIFASTRVLSPIVSNSKNDTNNPKLFVGIAPENWQRELSDENKQVLNEADQCYDPAITFGKRYLTLAIEQVSLSNSNIIPEILILGKGPDLSKLLETLQGFEVYRKCIDINKDQASFFDQDKLILKFLLDFSKIMPHSDLTVNAYYLNCYKNTELKPTLDLSNKSLAKLYKIYNHTIAQKKPLIIQSYDGLDEAQKLAFAFLILENFYKIFNSYKKTEVAKNLYKFYVIIKNSCLPNGLENLIDIQQAVYLAFCLKVIEVVKHCKARISNIITLQAGNKSFEDCSNKLSEILAAIKSAPDIKHKNAILLASAKDTKILSKSPKRSFFSSVPEQKTLLQILLNGYVLQDTVEEILFEKCYCSDLADSLGVARANLPKGIGIDDQQEYLGSNHLYGEAGEEPIEDIEDERQKHIFI